MPAGCLDLASLLAGASCNARQWNTSDFYPGGSNAACWSAGQPIDVEAQVQPSFTAGNASLAALYQNTVGLQLVDQDNVVQHSLVRRVVPCFDVYLW